MGDESDPRYKPHTESRESTPFGVRQFLTLPPAQNRMDAQIIQNYATGMTEIAIQHPESLQVSPSAPDGELPPQAQSIAAEYAKLWRVAAGEQQHTTPFIVREADGVVRVERIPASFDERWFNEFVEGALRGNFLMSSGLESYDIASRAILFALLGKNMMVVNSLLKTQSAEFKTNVVNAMRWMKRLDTVAHSYPQTPEEIDADIAEIRSVTRESPDAAASYACYLMVKAITETVANGSIPPELVTTAAEAIQKLSLAETAPETYWGGKHFARPHTSRGIVLLRDMVGHFAVPELSRWVNNDVMAVITDIDDYGTRFHALSEYGRYYQPAGTIIERCMGKRDISEGEWRDEIHTTSIETGTKGWWGRVEEFFSQQQYIDLLGGLVGKYPLPPRIKEYPPEHPYRYVRALTHAVYFDHLIREHGSAQEVLSLLNELQDFIRKTPDMARMRIILGDEAWHRALPVFQESPGAFAVFADTHPDGATESLAVPLRQLIQIAGRNDVGDLPTDVQKLKQMAAIMRERGFVLDNDVRSWMAAWHEYVGSKGNYGFASLFHHDHIITQAVNREIQLQPHSYGGVPIAARNWTARGPYTPKIRI